MIKNKERCIIFTVLLLLLANLSGCSSDNSDISSQPPTTSTTKTTVQYKTMEDVDANLLSLDIYHLEQMDTDRAVVIYVHGGGFATGDKANKMENKQQLFKSLGYILVSVNYRLSPDTYSTDPDRVKYPIHHQDVSDAIKWCYDNIDRYGGDNEKMALLGHSAGAQLVALAGTSNQFLPNRGLPLQMIRGVACIDTEGYDVVARCSENNLVYLNAFGQEDTFWFEASPINNLVSEVSYPKFFIAKRGSNRRIGYADDFIDQLKSAGVSTTQITANQYDHVGINEDIGATGEEIITEPLKSFFAQCFQWVVSDMMCGLGHTNHKR